MINGLLKDEMPREKLIRFGINSLNEVELLAIILRVGTKNKNVIELSREILKKFNLIEISQKTYNDLLDFKGISKVKATQIIAIFELSRRFSEKKFKEKIQLNSSKDIFDLVKMDFLGLEIEKVMIVLVDSKNQLIKKEFIFEGSINFSYIEPRKIIQKVLIYNASGFFLIHNHPSLDTNPSSEDIEITKKINKITIQLNIRFLDHLIIGNKYFSLFDNDLF